MDFTAQVLTHVVAHWPLYLGIACGMALVVSHWWQQKRATREKNLRVESTLASLVQWKDENIPLILNDIARVSTKLDDLQRTLDARVPPPPR